MYLTPAPLNSVVRFTDPRTQEELLEEIRLYVHALDTNTPIVAPAFTMATRMAHLHSALISLHRRKVDWLPITQGICGAWLEDVYLVDGIWYRFPDGKEHRQNYYLYAHLHGLHPDRDEKVLEVIPFNSLRSRA